MSLITVILLAVALAMDAFAVAIASGVAIKQMKLRHALRIAAFFGGFQAVMPLAGWSLGRFIGTYIVKYDHWIAFGLLSALGIKMIYESLKLSEVENQKDPLNIYVLLTLSFATSIDAAAVGVTMSFLNVDIIQPAIIIGVITFVIALAGTWIGKKSGDLFGSKIEVFGGLVLIGIGIKILVDHLLVK